MATWQDALDRWFGRSMFGPTAALKAPFFGGNREVDMYETDDSIVIEAPASGVKPEEIDVQVTGDTLVIKGETKAEQKEEKANYVYQERRYGAFSRSLQLPAAVKADKASAKFENGVLTLTLPKSEEAGPKHIKVRVESG
jgi:HSP20 family protein